MHVVQTKDTYRTKCVVHLSVYLITMLAEYMLSQQLLLIITHFLLVLLIISHFYLFLLIITYYYLLLLTMHLTACPL